MLVLPLAKHTKKEFVVLEKREEWNIKGCCKKEYNF